MSTASLAYTQAEATARQAFLALMWAFSYPGRVRRLPQSFLDEDDFTLIGRTLLDIETSYFCPDGALAARLARCGAKALAVSAAAYVFLPRLDEAALALIPHVKTGTHALPDESATLVIGGDLDAPDALECVCRGPGIEDRVRLRIGGVPPAFWALRRQMIHYPLGFDVFFVHRGRVVGFPRTTQVEVL
ncbi:MAG: phosphonate C-P lyase system protein PhnH [Candidatus Brachytrichaceae bacterium NZ_4S206]|jgi:alpha-D-ribose 1-methylphosphonate 5-triphosphate synthase subunit PhnH